MAEVKEAQQASPTTVVEEKATPRRDRAKISPTRVLALLRPYRWRLVIAAVLLVLTNGLGLLFPLVIRTLLNTILGQHNERLLNMVVVVLLAGFFFLSVLCALQRDPGTSPCVGVSFFFCPTRFLPFLCPPLQ